MWWGESRKTTTPGTAGPAAIQKRCYGIAEMKFKTLLRARFALRIDWALASEAAKAAKWCSRKIVNSEVSRDVAADNIALNH